MKCILSHLLKNKRRRPYNHKVVSHDIDYYTRIQWLYKPTIPMLFAGTTIRYPP